MHTETIATRALALLAQITTHATNAAHTEEIVRFGPLTVDRETADLIRSFAAAAFEIFLALVLLRLVPVLERWVIRWAGKNAAPQGASESTIDRRAHVETLTRVVANIAQSVIWITTFIMVISHFGVNIGPLLAGAGIAGVAVGFGAQSIVKDFFAGFFILLENQFDVGDTVTVASLTGTVERMTMRITVLRDANGTAYFIPNSTISNVANKTYGWGRAMVEAVFAAGVAETEVRAVLEAAAARASQTQGAGGSLMEAVEVEGPTEFNAGAVTWRLVGKAYATRTAEARRRMILALSQELRAHGFASEGSVLSIKPGRPSMPESAPH